MYLENTILLLFIAASLSHAFAEVCFTNDSIGLSNDTFAERGLIATSFLDVYHSPNSVRLYQPKAWAPIFSDNILHPVEEFVQITFIEKKFLVKIIQMQGDPFNDWWVTKFRVATSIDGSIFDRSAQVYNGNKDRSSVVSVSLVDLSPSVYFRVIPTAWNHHIALRLEVFGCDDFE